MAKKRGRVDGTIDSATMRSWRLEWKTTARALGYAGGRLTQVHANRAGAAAASTYLREARPKFRSSDWLQPRGLQVCTGMRPSRWGLIQTGEPIRWATTFTVDTMVGWPNDIQDEVNLHEDWAPFHLDDEDYIALLERVGERFGIDDDGRIAQQEELLQRLDEACSARVTVAPTDLYGSETSLYIWCSRDTTDAEGPYLATQDEMQPVLQALVDGARQFRKTHFELNGPPAPSIHDRVDPKIRDLVGKEFWAPEGGIEGRRINSTKRPPDIIIEEGTHVRVVRQHNPWEVVVQLVTPPGKRYWVNGQQLLPKE